MIAATFIRRRRSISRCEACLPEHPAQVDDHLLIDVVPTRPLSANLG
jgi:hypothetical protein